MREYTVNRRMTRTYTSTRRSANALNNRTSSTSSYSGYTTGFVRNRNMTHSKHTQPSTIGMVLMAIAIVFAFGLVYVNAGTKGTSFDYQIAAMDEKIDDLEAQKEDLAVERARLTSIAASENSQVAASMKDANTASTYVE